MHGDGEPWVQRLWSCGQMAEYRLPVERGTGTQALSWWGAVTGCGTGPECASGFSFSMWQPPPLALPRLPVACSPSGTMSRVFQIGVADKLQLAGR